MYDSKDEPGTASGSEVKVEAWAAQQPGLGEYAAAHRYMEEDARIGKVVISLKG
jgi:hypothetical protein